MKRTKIVATIGPASADPEILRSMINSGMDVCRLNFSHGTHDVHLQTVENIRKLNKEMGTHVALLADLQGPKLRVGEMPEGGRELAVGDLITFCTQDPAEGEIFMTYPDFAKDVKKGEEILLDDGKLKLEVKSTDGFSKVQAMVIHGGLLTSRKGVNLPNTKISLPSLTEKDQKDLEFVIKADVDWVALSFVREARDVIELRHMLRDQGSQARIIAKIEKPEAIEQMEDIVRESDGIMVARGDLGVELPMERVPLLQKELVKLSLKHAKPVIVATQMMESMIESSTPTRAEVNDVANAVLDGADAVMLSAETSVGKYPVEVIRRMASILFEMEGHDGLYYHEAMPERNQDRFISDSICFNACRLAQRVEADAIITMSFSGYTAYKIASQRPKSDIFVFTGNQKILNQLNLIWGVKGFFYDKMVSTDHTIADIKYLLKKEGLIHTGDLIINIASIPIEEKGRSNMLKLSQVD